MKEVQYTFLCCKCFDLLSSAILRVIIYIYKYLYILKSMFILITYKYMRGCLVVVWEVHKLKIAKKENIYQASFEYSMKNISIFICT